MNKQRILEIKEELRKRRDEEWLAKLLEELRERADKCLNDAMYAKSFESKEYTRGYYEALLSIIKLMEV